VHPPFVAVLGLAHAIVAGAVAIALVVIVLGHAGAVFVAVDVTGASVAVVVHFASSSSMGRQCVGV
jgi:hypothetical protein